MDTVEETKTTPKAEETKTNAEERKPKANPLIKPLLIGIAAAVVLAVVLIVVFSGSGKTELNIESSLKEIILLSDLQTAEYTYNSIAEIKDGDKVKYYVSYKGTLTAGFNFEDIRIEREGDVVRIYLPDVTLDEPKIETEMKYIFLKQNYETETIYAEARDACLKDLAVKAAECETLFLIARQSAKTTVEALVKPFESSFGQELTFEVIGFGESIEASASTTDTTTITTEEGGK